MTKIEIKFAELQSPLFLAGTNHGLKLQTDKRPIRMVHVPEDDKLYVLFNGEIAIIPCPNVATMTPTDSKELAAQMFPPRLAAAPLPVTPMPGPRKTIKAQASTPTDHVFAAGPGNTRDA